MERRDVIVIGGSAGSASPLQRLIRGLPERLKAAVFIVTHFPSNGRSYLVERLQDCTALSVVTATDHQPIELGCIYLPAPEHHLLLTSTVIRLGAGPRENMVRPAIDPLFRSAAVAFGPRVIGVLLSGYMNDGVSGLVAIRSRGGLTVVQDPSEAEVPDMPRAALQVLEPDHVARGDQSAPLLADLVQQPAPPSTAQPDRNLELEVRIAGGARLGSSALGAIAEPSALSCPHCHGVLSELKGEGPLRYRCQTGHAFTAEAALAEQQQDVDEALMVGLRVMEERVTLVTRMAEDARAQGHRTLAELYERRASEYGNYAATLRQAATRSLALADDEK